MKKHIPSFIFIIFLVSCLPKFTEIKDHGFGGGMKVNQIKRVNKNESELNLSLESKKDKVVINSESVKTGLFDSTELTTVQSNINKQDVKPNKTVTKLNKIFYPLMPKSVKHKFEKTIKSKSNIFGYRGDNEGMTIGYNILIYGLFAVVLGLTLGSTILTNVNPESNIDDGGCFVLFLVILGFFSLIIGGLIFLISMLVAYS